MRMLYVSLAALAALSLVGCGGGGGGSTTSVTPTATVDLTVPSGAAPAGVTPTVENKEAAEVSNIPGSVAVFVAAVECLPTGTVFSQPVTLTFDLANAVPAGKQVALFERNASNDWIGSAGTTVNLSADRKTATVQVDHFTANGYYMILTL
ncbi:MAG: hypothetical protein ACYC64_14895 [Armatimonadota bacterium]